MPSGGQPTLADSIPADRRKFLRGCRVETRYIWVFKGFRRPMRPRRSPTLIRSRGLCPRQAVLAVNILTELHDAVGTRPCGDIDPVKRHLLGELRVLPIPGFDDAVDILKRPAARSLQQP